MPIPLFPNLVPKIIDPLWFCADKPCDDENEILMIEQEHQTEMNNISQEDYDLVPIGKTVTEHLEEEDEEDDDEDDNDDDETSHEEDEEEELDMDVAYDPDPSVDIGLRISSGGSHGVR